jgi:hypothetical protein
MSATKMIRLVVILVVGLCGCRDSVSYLESRGVSLHRNDGGEVTGAYFERVPDVSAEELERLKEFPQLRALDFEAGSLTTMSTR